MRRKVTEKAEDPLVKRLNVIINLMLQRIETQDDGKDIKRKQIKLLKDMKLSNTEIANLLGKSEGYIRSALTKTKKGNKRKKSR